MSELTGHSLIAYADRMTTWSYRLADEATEEIVFEPAHVVSDSSALEPLLVGGAGIGRLPDFIARRCVANGELVRLLPDAKGDLIAVHALYTNHRSLSAKVRVFIDALVEYLAAAMGPVRGATDECMGLMA